MNRMNKPIGLAIFAALGRSPTSQVCAARADVKIAGNSLAMAICRKSRRFRFSAGLAAIAAVAPLSGLAMDLKPALQCPPAQARPTQMCLALDGSGSITQATFDQMKMAVASTIRSSASIPQDGSVTLSVVLFNEGARVKVSATKIVSPAVADLAARAVEGLVWPRGRTGIGNAIELCSKQFAFTAGSRHVINVVTDGENNDGIKPLTARDDAVARGVNVINGLGVGRGVAMAGLKEFVWPTPASEYPIDGFAKIVDWSEFPHTIAGILSASSLTLTSSSPGHASLVSGILAGQLQTLNKAPPAYTTTTAKNWTEVKRKKDVPATKAFKCSEVANPLDPTGALGLAYVSANTYMPGVDEVTYNNCNSAFYRFTFAVPQNVKSICLDGRANIDDIGVAYLNGNRFSPQIQASDVGIDRADAQGKPILSWPTQDQFGTSDLRLFKQGAINELVFAVAGDASPWEPTGLEFKARVIAQTKPAVTKFKIKDGVATIASRDVSLDNAASERPTHYIVSESNMFTGATWQPYATSPVFRLRSGIGKHTVYFKTKGANGESAVVADDIDLTGN